MKLHLLSDLHLEFHPFQIPSTDADVVILAGDISVRNRGLTWAIQNIPDKPVLYILGNHEYYGSAHPKLISKLKAQAAGSNVHILENDAIDIDGYRFLGCTLWTDFALFGEPRLAGIEASQVMNDFRKIRRSPSYSRLRSIDTAVIHKQSLAWLKQTLAESAPAKTVVITHHAPSDRSIPAEYKTDILSAAYASSLENFICQTHPKLWLHGHTHNSWNYNIGYTTLRCNTRGYPGELNPTFEPGLVLEI